MTDAPLVTRDPRFQAGCSLVQKGLAHEGAVEIFELLSEEAGNKHGESSIETAPAYYEYGNALLRAVNRRKMEQDAHKCQKAMLLCVSCLSQEWRRGGGNAL